MRDSLAIQRPPGIGAFQFVVLASLRAAQLTRGCRPKVDGPHKATVIAQLEVSAGIVTQVVTPPDASRATATLAATPDVAPILEDPVAMIQVV